MITYCFLIFRYCIISSINLSTFLASRISLLISIFDFLLTSIFSSKSISSMSDKEDLFFICIVGSMISANVDVFSVVVVVWVVVKLETVLDCLYGHGYLIKYGWIIGSPLKITKIQTTYQIRILDNYNITNEIVLP